jgi:UDP-N-acetylglucosamine 2-epimerase (non-hydrolysing)
LQRLVQVLSRIGARLPVVFPVHPRTRARMEAAQISLDQLQASGLLVSEPLGYLDFLQLEDAAAVVMTDSGGVQEETTALGVPCLTVRDNTERPITITDGTNKLVGSNPDVLPGEVDAVLSGSGRRGTIPELWDGKAGQRAADAIRSFLS